MVNKNMKFQVMQQSLSTVDIFIHPLIFFQIVLVFWFVMTIVER